MARKNILCTHIYLYFVCAIGMCQICRCERHCFCIAKYIWNLCFLLGWVQVQFLNHASHEIIIVLCRDTYVTNQQANQRKKHTQQQQLRTLKQFMDQIPHIHPLTHHSCIFLHNAKTIEPKDTDQQHTNKKITSVSFFFLFAVEMSEVHTFGRLPSVDPRISDKLIRKYFFLFFLSFYLSPL